jgi:hypothetical protein
MNMLDEKKYSKSSTSLHKWFSEEDWVRINTQGNITGPCGTMKNKKRPSRCLPRKKAQSLSKSERAATARKKKQGGKSGKQFVSNTKKAKVNKESIDMLFLEFSNSDLNILDSFKFKDSLSSKIFDDNQKMLPEVKERLLLIAQQFIDTLDLPIQVKDITLTGSLANYNWSEYSDIDLHILSDFGSTGLNKSLLRKYLDSKKSLWNDNYPIKLKGYDVELYAQDTSETHTSSGVYSIKNDDWVVEPKKESIEIDKEKILSKASQFTQEIDKLLKDKTNFETKSKNIERLKDKLKNFRKAGLESGGEYSYENLAFKFLRRSGYLEKLNNFKNDLITKSFSLKEKAKKDDRCTRIAKRKYDKWPSAYASGAVVQCRKGKIWKDLKEGFSDIRLETIEDFTNFCSDVLKVDSPTIRVNSNPNFSKEKKSFGYYSPQEKNIEISLHNRNLADILRTLGHEIVHHRQNLKGRLHTRSGEDGSPEENQANAVAGMLLRVYGRNNPHIYE